MKQQQQANEERRKLSEEFYKQPFNPAQNVEATLRIAAALEYIAAQMHTVNEKLEKIVLQGRFG
jgi:hypothetical protein